MDAATTTTTPSEENTFKKPDSDSSTSTGGSTSQATPDTSAYEQLGDMYYIIDRNNKIVKCGPEKEWNSFSQENGGQGLEANSLVGKDLFSFITGERTILQYKKIHDLIWSGKKKRFIIKSMCDSPEFRRPLRTCISAIARTGGDGKSQVEYLLYHHCVWDEHSRPPVHHLNCPHYGSGSNLGVPILYMCSYCKDVRYPAGASEGKWISSAEYYARCEQEGNKRADDVLLSHTVCDKCFDLVSADLEETCTQ